MYEMELYHHGIKGQRWGIRRFQNEDGSLKPAGAKRYSTAVESAKFLSGASRAASVGRAFKNEKSISGKASALFGHVGAAAKHEANARNLERISKSAKTRLGKHISSVGAYNNKSLASYHRSVRNMSVGKRVVNTLLGNPRLMNTRMKTMVGRETTVGKEVLMTMFTGGIGNTVLDARYVMTGR